MKLNNQSGVIHALPLLLIVAAVGVISFLLISSTAPAGGLFGVLNPKSASHAATNTTINGSQKFQTIDGFGSNAIPKSWNNGGLKPTIDTLVANGVNLWRVDVLNGHTTWESTNDDADPNNFNWTYYNNLYGGSTFSDLWAE